MGSLFKGPKISKEQKELNARKLSSERARVSEEKKKATDNRIAGLDYGIRSLLGGGQRGGYSQG